MSDLATFLRIVEQYPPGLDLTVDNLRDDLTAAQIRPSALGRLFLAACQRGVLTTDGRTKPGHKASRRGGRTLIYTRTAAGA